MSVSIRASSPACSCAEPLQYQSVPLGNFEPRILACEQVQCLQASGNVHGASVAAAEMEAFAKKDISEQHNVKQAALTVSSLRMSAGRDASSRHEELGNRVKSIVPDLEDEEPDLDGAYEAAVWAKVTLADLAMQQTGGKCGHRAGDEEEGTGDVNAKRKGSAGGGLARKQRGQRKARRARRGREGEMSPPVYREVRSAPSVCLGRHHMLFFVLIHTCS